MPHSLRSRGQSAGRPGILARARTALMSIAASVCASNAEANESPTIAARSPAIVVVVAPFSGPRAEIGREIRAGADAGAHGQGLKAALTFTSEDDRCDAARATAIARNIVARQPALVIGHPCAPAAIAAAKVYASAGVLFIAIGVRHPDLTTSRAGPTVFRMAGRDDRQGEAAAVALLNAAGERPIVIVQDRTAYARKLADATAAALVARKRPADRVIPLVAAHRSYDAELALIENSRPGAVLFAGFPAEAQLLIEGFASREADLNVVVTDAMASAEPLRTGSDPDGHGPTITLLRDTAATDLEGNEHATVATASPVLMRTAATTSARSDVAGNDDLARTLHGVLARMAVESWVGALAANPGSSPVELARALSEAPAPTAVPFDKNGDAAIPSYVAERLAPGRPRSDRQGSLQDSETGSLLSGPGSAGGTP